MKQAILIYTTDSWHTFSSREVIAIATTEKQRDTLVRRYLRNYPYEKLNRDEIAAAVKQVQEFGQTQGLPCDFELDTEEWNLNVILQ
ncbi:MAG: hypothetical protein IJ584_02690 [Bacteroidales bacterium]|nr:hypothetical protein [Bacteroidales bacterium]